MKEAGFQFELRIPSGQSEDYPANMKFDEVPVYTCPYEGIFIRGWFRK